MSFVIVIPRAAADCDRTALASGELLPFDARPDSAAKLSASATISLADAISASRSSKALPRTTWLFCRASRSRRSSPAIPTAGRKERWPNTLESLPGTEDAGGGVAFGTGGASWRIHFRCTKAFLSLS
ncbi:hypothetical protein ACKS0A_09658 [Histoplasma ohiense]